MTAAMFGARPIRVHRTRVSDVAASPRTSSVDPARQIEGRYGVVPCTASQSTAFPPLGHRGWRKMAVLTLPVERKYCARAITNSWAGTSFTVRGADGMVRARGKKGRTVRVRSKTLKTKGCARTERTFRAALIGTPMKSTRMGNRSIDITEDEPINHRCINLRLRRKYSEIKLSWESARLAPEHATTFAEKLGTDHRLFLHQEPR